MKTKTKIDRIKQEVDYVAFLKKRLESDNFKKNSTTEEIEKTKKKYDKAKLVLKILQQEKK